MQQQELFLEGIFGDRHGHGLLPSILGGGDGNPGILGQQQMQELGLFGGHGFLSNLPVVGHGGGFLGQQI